jgi:hypothetical protein
MLKDVKRIDEVEALVIEFHLRRVPSTQVYQGCRMVIKVRRNVYAGNHRPQTLG